MEEENIQKGILPSLTQQEEELLQMVWGLPAESILISTVHGNSKSYILENHINASPDTNGFHNCFNTIEFEEVNLRYFNWNPEQVYKRLETKNDD